MDHVTEEELAALAVGIAAEPEREDIAGHLAECPSCRRLAREYQEIAAHLRLWREPPAAAVEAASRTAVQRVRLHRLLGEMLGDPALRRQAVADPAGVLARRGITPTPQLLAAFRQLEETPAERFPGELDERIAKFLHLLD